MAVVKFSNFPLALMEEMCYDNDAGRASQARQIHFERSCFLSIIRFCLILTNHSSLSIVISVSLIKSRFGCD